MLELSGKEYKAMLGAISAEAAVGTVGFHDLHETVSEMKIRNMPKKRQVIDRLLEGGFKASETHLRGTGIRTDADMQELKSIIRQLA
jgi:tRNA G26 N,N-dimethylase Trm1